MPPPSPGDPLTRRAESRIGTVLRDKWRLDRLLGLGGMAAVYAATHRNGTLGAVKMLHPEMAIDAEARARFQREGYVANRVVHTGAVRVLDDDQTDDGSVYLVMELLEGETVDARANRRSDQRLPIGDVLAIADQLLDVLGAAHDEGIIHRDIKPENLFLTRTGHVKVLDFGIAGLRELDAEPVESRATRAGNAMGTPAFMPPEQALGDWEKVDARTDLWAAAATLYTLLTGRVVHEAATVQKQLLAAMTKPAAPIGKALPGLPPSVGKVIDRGLSFRQEDRFASARAFADALRGAAERDGVVVGAPRTSAPGAADSGRPGGASRAAGGPARASQNQALVAFGVGAGALAVAITLLVAMRGRLAGEGDPEAALARSVPAPTVGVTAAPTAPTLAPAFADAPDASTVEVVGSAAPVVTAPAAGAWPVSRAPRGAATSRPRAAPAPRRKDPLGTW